MATKAISIRVAPLTGRKAHGQKRHDLRDPNHIPDYIDKDKTVDNSVIIEPPDPTALRAEIARNRKKAHQQKLRADSRTVIAGVITFGADAQPLIDALPKESQDHIYTEVAKRISKETGHELIGLVVHRDESAPHAHFMLRGYRLDNEKREIPWGRSYEVDTEKNRQVMKAWKRDKMSQLQDAAAEVPEVKELGISRGVSKSDRMARGDDLSKLIHRSVHQLHHDLPAEIEKLETELSEQIAKAEKNRRLIDEQTQKLETQRVTEEQAAKRIKTYETREQKALNEINELQQKLASLQKIEGIELPKPPELAEYQVVTESGFLGRPKQTTVYKAIPLNDMRDYVRKVQAIPEKAAAAINKERELRHSIDARLKNEMRLHKQTQDKMNALQFVLDSLLQSKLATILRENSKTFDDWATEREREKLSPFVESDTQHSKAIKRDSDDRDRGFDF